MKFNEYYENLNSEIKEYFKIITHHFPKFLIPFINSKLKIYLLEDGLNQKSILQIWKKFYAKSFYPKSHALIQT